MHESRSWGRDMGAGWTAVSTTATLDAAELSAREARQLVRTVLADARVPAEATETALLLVSELVTNAVLHADGRPVLDVEVEPDRLRISVSDVGRGAPQVQTNNPLLSDHGRGMLLVDTLSTRWGTEPKTPRGKCVWFELEAS
jgi:anti-sigma regulatory factor (Ser/Thr protein kinase)